MSMFIQNLDVTAFLRQQASDVFQTMVALEVGPASNPDGLHGQERITGIVGLGGEQVTGAVYLHLPVSFAEQVTRQLLGLEGAEPLDEAAVNDVTGELTNMLAGGFKSALCDRGLVCAVSTPTIIRGTAYEIEMIPDVQRTSVPLSAGTHPLLVEAHLKLG